MRVSSDFNSLSAGAQNGENVYPRIIAYGNILRIDNDTRPGKGDILSDVFKAHLF